MNVDASNKLTPNTFEITENKKTNPPKGANLKTSEISQQALVKSSENLKPQKELNNINAQHITNSDSKISSPKNKLNFIGNKLLTNQNANHKSDIIPQILQEDLQRKNESANNSSLSKFAFMTIDELIEVSGKTENMDELNEINTKLKELETQENQKIKETNVDNKSELKKIYSDDKKLSKTSNLQKTEEIKNETDAKKLRFKDARILDNGVFRLTTPKDDLKTLLKFIHLVNAKTGTLSTGNKTTGNYKIGQTIRIEDENGNIQHVNIKKIIGLSEEELHTFKQSYLAYFNTLNPPIHEKSEKKTNRNDITQENPSISNQSKVSSNKKLNSQAKAKRVAHPRINLATIGKSQRKINQERLEKLEKQQELMQEIVKIGITKYELSKEQLKQADSSRSVEKNSINLEEQYATNNDIDNQYKELMKMMNGQGTGIEIPLATIEKFQKFEITFIQLTKMMPKESVVGNHKVVFAAMQQIIPLKKEVMALVKDVISSSGGIKTMGTGRSGKSMATPA